MFDSAHDPILAPKEVAELNKESNVSLFLFTSVPFISPFD
jgi:hypothetical protein